MNRRTRSTGHRKNTKWLAGIRCPECGAREPVWIQARVLVKFSDDRVETYKEPEWDHDSYMSCDACNHAGQVVDFLEDE